MKSIRSHAGQGFTLVELMVAVAVLAILVSIAAPTFTNMMVNNRLKGYGNAMMSTLLLARSEAIKRNARVVLCKSSNGTACTGNWQDGWIVFVDSDNDAAVDAGEEIVHKIGAMASGYTLSGGVTNVANYVSYTAQGVTRLTSNGSQTGTFTLCPPSPAPSGSGRAIEVGATGRPRIESIATCS